MQDAQECYLIDVNITKSAVYAVGGGTRIKLLFTANNCLKHFVDF